MWDNARGVRMIPRVQVSINISWLKDSEEDSKACNSAQEDSATNEQHLTMPPACGTL